MIKFFTTTYSPLDKDIVREMWVKGDLKDRLGIQHRRSNKNKSGASNLEFTPMFHEPHSRSVSEVSSLQNHYEPTMTRSPGSTGMGTPPTRGTLLDTPPRTRARDADLEMQTRSGYVVTRPSFEVGEDDPTPIATNSRNPLTGTGASPEPRSPHPSYYSVSDIPIPSPAPSPIYRLTSGEYTSTPPSRAPSMYTVRSNAGPSSPPRSPPAPRSPHALQLPHQNYGSKSSGSGSSGEGTFEMRVRSPPHSEQHYLSPSSPLPRGELSRGASEASYATAQEFDESDHGHHTQDDSHSFDNDRATITAGDRLSAAYNHERPVSVSSWDGGRAL